jgi:hypothetical protein
MARILFATELASSPADLRTLRGLAITAARVGHVVFVALPDVELGHRMFARTRVTVLASPAQVRRVPKPIRNASGFAGLLWNAGFALVPRLAARAASWRTLFMMVRPNTLVAYRAPTALLAARGTNLRTVLADGSGALTPPGTQPLPLLRPWSKPDPDKVAAAEKALLERCNAVLKMFKAKPMDSLGDLFAATATVFATYNDLDPFGRRAVIYLGGPKPQPAKEGTDPEWPAAGAKGSKVLALIRTTRGAEKILEGLKASGQPVLAVVPRLPKEVADKFEGSNVKLASGKFDAARALAACDVVVTHGAHGTIIGALRHGKPVLVLPLNTEHRLVGQRVVEQGVGLMPDQLEDGTLGALIGRLTGEPSFAKNAADFAERVAKPPKQNPAALYVNALGPVPKKPDGKQQPGKGGAQQRRPGPGQQQRPVPKKK